MNKHLSNISVLYVLGGDCKTGLPNNLSRRRIGRLIPSFEKGNTRPLLRNREYMFVKDWWRLYMLGNCVNAMDFIRAVSYLKEGTRLNNASPRLDYDLKIGNYI